MARKSKKISESIDLSRKKVKEFDVDTNIKVAYKTGKMLYGKAQVLRQIRQDPFKMIIIANNCPDELVTQLRYYNSLINNNIFLPFTHSISSLEPFFLLLIQHPGVFSPVHRLL